MRSCLPTGLRCWKRLFPRDLTRARRDIAPFCQEQAHWLPDYALFMSIKGTV